ncbi:MAG: hypothetical protein IPG99_14005 [Ignavibacteria bacterium]|nr:hypothetical protein [Ignavibacteria bacterium]
MDKVPRSIDATFLDAEGRECYNHTGSYGIGVERTVAAYIEQNNGERELSGVRDETI